jgi:monoamine oxidase
LIQQSGLKTLVAEGAAWRSKNGRLFQQESFIENANELMEALEQQHEETSIGSFLEQHFKDSQYTDLRTSIQGYVEGYYAGELHKASVLALKEEWQQAQEPQYRVQGGYAALMQALYDECHARTCSFHFLAQVKTIAWAFEKVTATTGNGSTYTAPAVIITVPAALLQKESAASISFQPEPTDHLQAFQDLGSGDVIKILVEFKTAFWNEFNLTNLSFLFSEEVIPTWWTQHPQQSSLLVGWCAGPRANLLKEKTDDQLFQKAMQSLAHCFNRPVQEVETAVRAWQVCNWAADPFTQGGYSYITTKTKAALRVLSKPVDGTIYFAGEALYDNINTGTVEAALQSGKQVAQALLRAVG